jgi:inner membrane transporter RhtA
MVLLLAPIGTLRGLDPLSILFACGAATGWAAYILLTSRTSKLFSSTTGLALAMSAAALTMLPLGVLSAGAALLNGPLLLKGLLVAMLSTTIPFSLEAVLLLLGERPTLQALLALVLLSAATIGVMCSTAHQGE